MKMGKRVLNDDGSFTSFNEVKKSVPATLEKPVSSVPATKVNSPKVNNSKIVLNGEETNSELKAHLDSLKIAYSKTANKENLLGLLSSHSVKAGGSPEATQETEDVL